MQELQSDWCSPTRLQTSPIAQFDFPVRIIHYPLSPSRFHLSPLFIHALLFFRHLVSDLVFPNFGFCLCICKFREIGLYPVGVWWILIKPAVYWPTEQGRPEIRTSMYESTLLSIHQFLVPFFVFLGNCFWVLWGFIFYLNLKVAFNFWTSRFGPAPILSVFSFFLCFLVNCLWVLLFCSFYFCLSAASNLWWISRFGSAEFSCKRFSNLLGLCRMYTDGA